MLAGVEHVGEKIGNHRSPAGDDVGKGAFGHPDDKCRFERFEMGHSVRGRCDRAKQWPRRDRGHAAHKDTHLAGPNLGFEPGLALKDNKAPTFVAHLANKARCGSVAAEVRDGFNQGQRDRGEFRSVPNADKACAQF